MSKNSWVLRGIDPEARKQAGEAAGRQGVSLADYLTGVLEQRAAALEPEQAPDAPQDFTAPRPPFILTPEPSDAFHLRHRLDAVERRASLALNGIDGAVRALDSSVFGLAARVDDAEMAANEAAHAFDQALAAFQSEMAALRASMLGAATETEQRHTANQAEHAVFHEQHDAQAERQATLEHRVDAIESVAARADVAAAVLANHHEALKRALAEDFGALADDTAERFLVVLNEARAAADAGACRAEAAAGDALNEIQLAREAIEHAQERQAWQLDTRIAAAESEAAARCAALSVRVEMAEHAAHDAAAAAEHASAQAQAAFAAEAARLKQEVGHDIEATNAGLESEVDDLRERERAGASKLKLVDAALTNIFEEFGELRETIERRAGEALAAAESGAAHALAQVAAQAEAQAAALARAQSQGEAKSVSLTLRLDESERQAARDNDTLRDDLIDEIARVASSARSGFEKADAALQSEQTEMRARFEHEMAGLHKQIGDALTRLGDVDAALAEAAHDQADSALASAERLAFIKADFSDRIARLEDNDSHAEINAHISRVEMAVSELNAKIDARPPAPSVESVEELRVQTSAQEKRGGETADRVNGLARLFGRLSAQTEDAAAQSAERAQKLELSLADMRLERLTPAPDPSAVQTGERLQSLETSVAALRVERLAPPPEDRAAREALAQAAARLGEFEQRQASLFDTLRADIAQALAESDRRLASLELGAGANTRETSANVVNEMLEQLAAAVEARFTALEQRDMSEDFNILRRRVEDRILAVEQKSVRALEQVSDTVALIGRKLAHQGADEDGDIAEARSA